MRDLGSLDIRRLILHEVPASSKFQPGPPVSLSTTPVALTTDNRRYVRERLVKDLARDARQVIEDPNSDSPIPEAIRKFLGGSGTDEEFVAMSQDFATHLREVQSGISPTGMVLVADCELAGGSVLLLAKVELERGVQAKPTQGADGSFTYDMTVLDDLVFGQTSRIYKVGLFGPLEDEGALLAGVAIDRQASGPDLAGFFLHAYLGCQYTQRPEVLTQSFMNDTQEWINSTIADPEKKARYELALLSEMQSQASEISPRDFATRSIDSEDRDAFISSVVAAQAVPRFPKDVSLVKIRRVKIETASGVMILADADQVQSALVSIGPEEIVVKETAKRVVGDGRMPRPKNDGSRAAG